MTADPQVRQEQDHWSKVPHWLLPRVKPMAVVVYAKLAAYAWMPDGARPAIKRVARELEISEASVERAIRELVTAQAITVERRWADTEKRISLPSRYTLYLRNPDAPGVTGEATPGVTDDGTPGVTGEVREKTDLEGRRSKELEGRAKSTRATRLPDSWMPSDSVIQAMKAECPTVDLESEHRKFCDHWKAAPGRNGVKADWDATWRNWIRRAAPSSYARPRRSTTDDAVMAVFEAAGATPDDLFAPKEITR